MSTLVWKGDATFTYNVPVSPFGTEVVTLAIPLFEAEPADRRSRYDWWAEDYSTREVVTVGDGVREIHATIRLDNEPTALKQMLRYALQYDLTLSYEQDSVVYPVRLVAIIGATDPSDIPLRRDRDRYGYGEWEVRVHLRRTDGGSLDGIIGGT